MSEKNPTNILVAIIVLVALLILAAILILVVIPSLSLSGSAAATGSIVVNSNPQGAAVYLDGVYQGTTPLAVRDVSAGDHRLELRLDMHVTLTRDIAVQADEVATLSIDLIPVTPTPSPTMTPEPTVSPAGTPAPEQTPTPEETPLPPPRQTPVGTPIPFQEGPTSIILRALDNEFDRSVIQFPAETNVEIKFENYDTEISHNFAVYQYINRERNIFRGQVISGPMTLVYSFRTPDPGVYYFQDDIYPQSMNGIFVVNPVAAGGYCPVGYVPIQLIAKGSSYDVTSIRVPYNRTGDSTTVIYLINQDPGTAHNFVLYSDPETKLPVFRGNSIFGPQSTVYTFKTPEPGTYYFKDDIQPGFVVGEYISYDVPLC